MKLGSLCSGAGGLDLAVEQVFGAETAWHCELDPAASKVLAHQWPGVPNHGDLITTDWSSVEPVDIMCFGWPCQPFSLAGQRKGHEDERAIWPRIADAVRILRPRICVMENVAAVLGSEFQRVADDMAALRYDLRWTCLRASDVGAPHRRERVFILATAADSSCSAGGNTQLERVSPLWPKRGTAIQQPRERGDTDSACGGNAADASGDGWHEGRPESAGFVGGSDAALSGDGPLLPTPAVNDIGEGKTVEWWDEWTAKSKAKHGNGNGHGNSLAIEAQRMAGDGPVNLLPTPVAHDGKGTGPSGYNRRTPDLQCIDYYLPTPAAADGNRGQDLARANRAGSGGDDLVTLAVKADRANQWGKYAPAIKRWEQIAGPAPSPTEPNRNGNPRLNPAFSEWMMGWPAGWVTDVPGISRNDALRIIGNGVVPQQAAAALQWLLSLQAVA